LYGVLSALKILDQGRGWLVAFIVYCEFVRRLLSACKGKGLLLPIFAKNALKPCQVLFCFFVIFFKTMAVCL